ncbi:hypothetical protein Pla163_32100 [Planctomycetes bacterium Pla163]|jgi:hypothetical protein|uniref:Curli production assembly/transport component CsgG n=1 Tax=Rohdeia mirabilis TaxID=2528008 RepID=A0A518D3K3_9BACT|nr:hypothetical protein Pla163_32100 [Planctomycetes bacterium Pla163]
MNTSKIAWILASAALLGSCRSPQYVPQRAMPAPGPSDEGMQEVDARHDGQAASGQAGSGQAPDGSATEAVAPTTAPAPRIAPPRTSDSATAAVESFCAAILARGAGAGSIGCLPLVSQDLRTEGPWVAEYGVDLADQVAERVRAHGFTQQILDTSSIAARLARAELAKTALFTVEAVAQDGGQLGLDVLTFGTVRRDNNVGRAGRDVLTVDLCAWDFRSDAMLAREKFEIPSDVRSNARIWRLASTSSLWSPDARWSAPEVPAELGTLMDQLRGDVTALGAAVLETLESADVTGVVYIAPTDFGVFVQAIADLRAAQATYGAEYNRRADEAVAAGVPLDAATPVALNGRTYPNLQAARAHVETLRESLLTSRSVRFGELVSSMLGDAVASGLREQGVRVNDLGFTKWSDTQLVEGELALGGLARSAAARIALREAGFQLIVAPRLERFGNDYALRVDIYDVVESDVVGSAHVALSPNYRTALQQELDVRLGGIR